MADEEDGDANDKIEDEEDEASEKLMVLHINFVNLKLPDVEREIEAFWNLGILGMKWV
ncbi:hypothetical protein KY289_001235 [Solanum tuberosum]|nr:hypothetical protein KY289_001235 [Solanum tuberosum]